MMIGGRKRVMIGLLTAFLLTGARISTTSTEETGSLHGTVDDPRRVIAVTAIDRATDRTFRGTLDQNTGRFTIGNLPLDGVYDCILDCAGGARWEGVNLKVPPDEEEEQPLSTEDRETIKTKVRGLNQFEDVVEILAVRGNSHHAAVLLNKVRAQPFVNSKPGEVIWRAELWHFERPEETWVKVQDELFVVLHRERLPKMDYAKKSVTFDAALGGLTVTRKEPSVDLGLLKVPTFKPGIRLQTGERRNLP
jgi:hypothetical protein